MTKEIDWHKNLILCTSMLYVQELIAGYFKQYQKISTTPPKVLEIAKTHEITLLQCILSSGGIICECALIIHCKPKKFRMNYKHYLCGRCKNSLVLLFIENN